MTGTVQIAVAQWRARERGHGATGRPATLRRERAAAGRIAAVPRRARLATRRERAAGRIAAVHRRARGAAA